MSVKSERKRANKALVKLGNALCTEIVERENRRDDDGVTWYTGALIVVVEELRKNGSTNYLTAIDTSAVREFWQRKRAAEAGIQMVDRRIVKASPALSGLMAALAVAGADHPALNSGLDRRRIVLIG